MNTKGVLVPIVTPFTTDNQVNLPVLENNWLSLLFKPVWQES